jgi:RHS repeat-associated protein
MPELRVWISSTQLDYANQRWYTSTYGRFTSPDRFKGSRWTSHPQTWNAYSYVMGDPINHRDHSGREQDCGTDDTSPCGYDCSSLPVDSFYDPSCQMEPSGGDSGEGPVDSSHPGPTCDQLLTAQIQGYLDSKNSPLASLAAQFVQDGEADNVDPRYLVALSRGESTWGKRLSNKQGPFNAWSVSTCQRR